MFNTLTVRTWDLMIPRPSWVLVTNPDRQLPCHFSKTVLRIPSKRNLHVFHIYFFCGGKFLLSVCRYIKPLLDAALCRSTSIHHTLQFYAKCELVGAGPLHLAYARPFGRLKAPLGLSLLRFAAQTRTTLFLLCTKPYIVWRKIGVWCSFCWKFAKRKSLKLLVTSRSFRLCFA